MSELPGSALVLAPHADDEAMGCSGLMARLAAGGARIHVVYLAVDGFHHYGLEEETTYAERVAEIEHVLELFGERCSYEIAYGEQDLIERLDSLPQLHWWTRVPVLVRPSTRSTHLPVVVLTMC